MTINDYQRLLMSINAYSNQFICFPILFGLVDFSLGHNAQITSSAGSFSHESLSRSDHGTSDRADLRGGGRVVAALHSHH